MQQYMTRQEAANTLRISLVSLWRLVRSGKLACARVGHRVLLRAQDLDQLVTRSMAKSSVTSKPRRLPRRKVSA
jgi:excisionase family DNA binding protein